MVVLYNSPLGIFELAGSSDTLYSVSLAKSQRANFVAGDMRLPWVAQLDEYFAGKRTHFEFPFVAEGTFFQRTVWALVEKIPRGETISYSALAEKLGRPEAVRAVAQALGKNPLLLIIPCHRVVCKNGELGGYSGGVALKKALLDYEAALVR